MGRGEAALGCHGDAAAADVVAAAAVGAGRAGLVVAADAVRRRRRRRRRPRGDADGPPAGRRPRVQVRRPLMVLYRFDLFNRPKMMAITLFFIHST